MIAKSKHFSMILFLALSLLSWANTTNAEFQSAETKKVILALFEAFNRHDTAALVELYAEDAQILSPGDTQPRYGLEVVREIYDGHFDNIPGVHDAVQTIITDGDQGAVEFIASWDQPTEDNPTARESLKIASFITVKNGKIIKDITYFDRMELSEKMTVRDQE